MTLTRYADRPDLLARRHAELAAVTFPAYMHENEPGNLYWGRLYSDFPDFEVALVDDDELLAEAYAVPLPWDGSLDDLPSGWEEGFVRGMTAPTRDCVDGDCDQRLACETGPLVIQDGVVVHVEPNVWVLHRLS